MSIGRKHALETMNPIFKRSLENTRKGVRASPKRKNLAPSLNKKDEALEGFLQMFDPEKTGKIDISTVKKRFLALGTSKIELLRNLEGLEPRIWP